MGQFDSVAGFWISAKLTHSARDTEQICKFCQKWAIFGARLAIIIRAAGRGRCRHWLVGLLFRWLGFFFDVTIESSPRQFITTAYTTAVLHSALETAQATTTPSLLPW
jgi:hypothetical protein